MATLVICVELPTNIKQKIHQMILMRVEGNGVCNHFI